MTETVTMATCVICANEKNNEITGERLTCGNCGAVYSLLNIGHEEGAPTNFKMVLKRPSEYEGKDTWFAIRIGSVVENNHKVIELQNIFTAYFVKDQDHEKAMFYKGFRTPNGMISVIYFTPKTRDFVSNRSDVYVTEKPDAENLSLSFGEQDCVSTFFPDWEEKHRRT